VRMSSQRSSDPSWPPQNADSVYASGRWRLVWSATYVNEKSRRARALTRTAAATSVVPNAATSAFCAEAARRRRRR
jgi:hypothetical protein